MQDIVNILYCCNHLWAVITDSIDYIYYLMTVWGYYFKWLAEHLFLYKEKEVKHYSSACIYCTPRILYHMSFINISVMSTE